MPAGRDVDVDVDAEIQLLAGQQPQRRCSVGLLKACPAAG